MTIEKILPVQIEVWNDDPTMCAGGCVFTEGGFRCQRYDNDSDDVSRKSYARHPGCIKDFGIPCTQTDLNYANIKLDEANKEITKLKGLLIHNEVNTGMLRVLAQKLEADNMKLAEAYNGATRFVFVDASPPVDTRIVLPTAPCCDPTILCRQFPCQVYGKFVTFHVKHGPEIYCTRCAFYDECPRLIDVKSAKVSHYTEVSSQTGQPVEKQETENV